MFVVTETTKIAFRSGWMLGPLLIAGLVALNAVASVGAEEEAVPEMGPHNGRLLIRDGVSLELAIYERGIPPEFRAWIERDGQPEDLEDAVLTVDLERLDGTVDSHRFSVEENFLRGDAVVYEPHSFAVRVTLDLDGSRYQWRYDNFEGRTRIASHMASTLGIETAIAGPVEIARELSVRGRVTLPPPGRQVLRPRFPGVVLERLIESGQAVRDGDPLFVIESNSNLRRFTVVAPMTGVLIGDLARVGDVVDPGRSLGVLMDVRTVWVELDIFPDDQEAVRLGQPVVVRAGNGDREVGTIDWLSPVLDSRQARIARVVIDNATLRWPVGAWVEATVELERVQVPLAVRRTGLQSFRDFTVVYQQIGDQYEVRMLELGRGDRQWVEVQAGLKVGARYVTENSFIVKADIEKSGASHDH